MRIRFVSLFVILCALVGALTVAAQSADPELQLEAARKRAVIDGDHDTAVRDYQAIADRYRTTEPGVAATALLSLAEAFDSVADVRAAGVYSRLVAEHPNHVEARTARARLGQAAGQSARTQRPVWEGQGASWSVRASADGRFLPFVEGTELFVRDFATGTNTRLAAAPSSGGEFPEGTPIISRDGRRIAYIWWVDGGNTSELRVIDREGMKPKTVATRATLPDISYVQPLDWLPGDDRLVVSVRRRDRTAQIGFLSLADGAYRSLKSVDWRGPTNLVVSPDGRSIAYDLPVSDTSRDREVYTLRVDGTRAEQRVSDRPGRHSVVGWTPDGGMILFATERAGTMVLQGTSVADGVAAGLSTVIEPDLGAFDGSRGVTDDGRLLFTKKVGGVNVFTAEIDFSSATLVSAPEQVTESGVSDHSGVMWSPDGHYLAYVSRDRGGQSLLIRSSATGATREIAPPVAQIQFPRWTAPGFITFQGSDFRGRQGIFRTDVQTGETSLAVGGDEGGYRSWADATPDGRYIVYGNSATSTMFARELATGKDRVITSPGPFTGTSVSPDGRMVGYRTGDRERSSIMVVPIGGGDPQPVLTVPTSPPGLAHFVQWLPDGRRLLAGTNGKLLVARLGAGIEREVDLPGNFGPNFVVHPDGRHVAFSRGSLQRYELWALENFLPPAKDRDASRP